MANSKIQQNGGPATPKAKRLEELIELLTNMKTAEPDPRRPHEAIDNGVLQEAIEALDWTHTMLENRRFYMKRQQLKKKISYKLACEALQEHELKVIQEQANQIVEQIIADTEGDAE